MGCLPPSFFSRLMIRLVKETKALCNWLNGLVIVSDLHSQNRALLELNNHAKILKISVKGDKPVELMGIATSAVENLLQYFSIRKFVRIFVICPHCTSMGLKRDEVWRFPIEACEAAVSAGLSHLYCHDQPTKPVRIDQLVPEVVLQGLTKIDFEELSSKEKIAYGSRIVPSSCELLKCFWKGECVVVRKLKDQLKFKQLMAEAINMTGLQHPNLISLRGVCIDPPCLVLEYLPYGSLQNYFKDPFNKAKPGVTQSGIQIAIDVANGMNFLHSATPPIIFKNLKPSNILLGFTSQIGEGQAFSAKVDFASSWDYTTASIMNSNVVSTPDFPFWDAPEALKDSHHTARSDVYSFGIILWQLVTNQQFPYSEFTDLAPYPDELLEAISEGMRPTFPLAVPYDYTRLIDDCWNKEVSKRPLFSEILRRLQAFSMRFSYSAALFENTEDDASDTQSDFSDNFSFSSATSNADNF